MSAVRVLALYRLTFSTLLIVASVQTILTAPSEHVVLLGGSEIAGALILCWRRIQWLGASLLVTVFACAQLMSAFEGEWPTRFVLYASSALLIVAMDRALALSR